MGSPDEEADLPLFFGSAGLASLPPTPGGVEDGAELTKQKGRLRGPFGFEIRSA
jgi:hypothetical protein